jgi:hypothetical protein
MQVRQLRWFEQAEFSVAEFLAAEWPDSATAMRHEQVYPRGEYPGFRGEYTQRFQVGIGA